MHGKHMHWHVFVQDRCPYGSEDSTCVPKSLMSMIEPLIASVTQCELEPICSSNTVPATATYYYHPVWVAWGKK